LTLSRFYGLHVYVVPAIILTAVVARLFIFGKQSQADNDGRLAAFARSQFVRNTVVAGLAFLGLAVFAAYFPAPFGPQAAESATYLPRPGPQFLWLFEMQKYTDGPVAALLAVGFPALAICGLISLALFKKGNVGLLRAAASGIFAVVFGTITVLTCVAIYQDREPRIADQLAKQEVDEAKFRASAFEPQIQAAPPAAKKETQATSNKDIAPELASVSESLPVPACYPKNCAKCHGANGEGTSKFPELAGVTTREDDQLTPELVLAIIDDPKTVGRSSKMPAYKTKLSDLDKQELVTWIKSLSPKPDAAAADEPVQTAKVGDKQQ
jgi:ubiquinol-cytochrome c reductase cytochrome b subunit